MNENEQLRKIFILSSSVGECLQKSANVLKLTPHQGMAALMLTLGRIMAREGFSTLDQDTAWDFVVCPACKTFFDLGFSYERDIGNLGADPHLLPLCDQCREALSKDSTPEVMLKTVLGCAFCAPMAQDIIRRIMGNEFKYEFS